MEAINLADYKKYLDYQKINLGKICLTGRDATDGEKINAQMKTKIIVFWNMAGKTF